jgi:hypothetical protein
MAIALKLLKYGRLAIRTLSTMSEQIPSTELSGYYAWTHTLQGVYYGPGSVSTALPKLLDTLGASKALVVTGNSLYTKVCLIEPPFLRPDPGSLILRRQML